MADNEEMVTEDPEADAQDSTSEPTMAPEPTEPVIKYYYNPTRNERSESFQGVPKRNLTEDEVKAYPRWLQKSLAAAKFYQAEPVEEEPK